MATNARKPLLEVGSVKGFASALSPLAIPQGYVSELNDVRLEDGTVKVRDGGVLILGYVYGAYDFRGCFECVQNGVPTIFWAGRSDGKTVVVKSVDAGATWTLVTPASGPYGDTRFPSEGWVRFALVTSYGVDWVVMQNGTDAPRLYDGTKTVVLPTAIQQPSEPVVFYFMPSVYGFGYGTVTASTPAQLDGATTYANGAYQLTLTVKPAVTDAAKVTIASTSPALITFPTLTSDRSFAWLVDSGDESWRSVKIEVAATTSGPWSTLYDPTSDPLVAVPSSGTAYLAASQRDIKSLSGMAFGAIRFTYLGDQPDANVKVKFFQFFVEGDTPGTTNYAAAFESADGGGAGPGRIATRRSRLTIGAMPLPESPLLDYSYSVGGGDQPLPSGGFTRVGIYRQSPGETGYYRITAVTPLVGGAYNYNDTPRGTEDYTRPLPRADALLLPVGTSMESVNGRLFVCSGNRLYYSEAGNPFAFASTIEFSQGQANPDSAGSLSKPGETFQAVVGIGQVLTGPEATGNPLSGAVSLYALTDRKTYVMSGYDALSLNKTTAICIGTRSPYSIARSNGGFYMLDSERQVRRVEGSGSTVLSKNVVDDRTKAVPDPMIGLVWGCFLDGRYRMSYARAMDTQNTRILVFSERLGGFESIDRPFAPPPSALLPYYDAAQSRYRIFGFGSTSLAELEAPGATVDAGDADIVGRIVFPEQRGEFDESLRLGAFHLISDPDLGTATFSAIPSTGPKAGQTIVYNAISLFPKMNEAASTRVARSSTTNDGATTLTVIPILEFAAAGGKRIYRADGEFSIGTPASKR